MAILTELFTNTANAIRTKTGSTAAIVAKMFPSAIANIQAGGMKHVEGSVVANTSFSQSISITLSGFNKIHHMYIVQWYKTDFSDRVISGNKPIAFTAGDINLSKGGSSALNYFELYNYGGGGITTQWGYMRDAGLSISFSSSSVLTLAGKGTGTGTGTGSYYYYYFVVGE